MKADLRSAEQLLDLSRVSDVTGYSRSTVKRWVSSGRLRSHKAPARTAKRVVRRDDLEAFINTIAPPAPADERPGRGRRRPAASSA